MTADLDAPLKEAVQGGQFNWVIMLQIGLDTGTVYAHTGVGDLSWDGATWLGVGSMAQFSGLTETADGGDDRLTVALTGIPVETMPDFVDEFTLQHTAGAPWFMYIAKLDDDGEIDGEPTEIGAGLTGGADLIDGPTRSVTVSLVTEAAQMRSRLFYYFTNEDQQKFFSGDLGFEFMTDLVNELRWGSADPTPVAQERGIVTNHTRSFDR